MKTVVFCTADQFCPDQKETGGVNGIPVVYHCMTEEKCRHPGKQCLFVICGGNRP